MFWVQKMDEQGSVFSTLTMISFRFVMFRFPIVKMPTANYKVIDAQAIHRSYRTTAEKG